MMRPSQPRKNTMLNIASRAFSLFTVKVQQAWVEIRIFWYS